MIFDTPTKPSGGGGGGLLKSPHHKSTSALSDVQMTTPPSSKHLAPSHRGKSQTLAATESPSYLSSIGGYQDDFELSPSSSIASGNTSFVSNTGGGGGQQIRGSPGYQSGAMNLEDEIMHHLGGLDDSHSRSSPTGSYSSAHKQDHAHHFELPTASSPITRYKRASSPTIGFPTESSHHQFVLSHETHPRSAGHHPEKRRSHSPDFTGGVRDPYPASYNPPSAMNQAAVASGYHQKSRIPTKSGSSHHYQQQRSVGGVSPHGRHHQGERQREMDPREAQMRYNRAQGSKTMPNPSRNPGHGNPPMMSGGGGAGGMPEGVGGQQKNQGPPQRGPRKASDQEMGLLEVLNMWDKSNQNPFGDGTLV